MTSNMPSASVRTLPLPGRYRHFKGGDYELLSVATHTETKEPFVVYRSVEDPDRVWVRPLEMFLDVVEGPKGACQRFEPANGLLAAPRVLSRLHDLVASAVAFAETGRSLRRQ